MIERAIKKISLGQSLSRQDTYEAVSEIVSGQASEVQIAAFLVGLRVKGETVPEIAGGVRALLASANRIQSNRAICLDIVGTGGDCTGTFNISSAAALVAAAAGVCVAKHGNRSVSSRCGSADVFEALGIELGLSPEEAGRCLDENGFAFLYAPVYHPAMRHAAPVRRQLGIRSLFNLVGPLASPAGANAMLVGVCDTKLLSVVAETLNDLGVDRALVVCGRDGADEISLSGPTDYCQLDAGRFARGVITPEDYGLTVSPLDSIQGGSPSANADLIVRLLSGQKGPARDIVVLNAGAALQVAGKVKTIGHGIQMACQAIDSGAAREKLESVQLFRKSGKQEI